MTKHKLLVIDDEPAFARLVATVALELDYEVEATTSWQAFQDAFQRMDPTTIIMDIVMPKMDGIELVQWLAKMGCTARIILITGYTPDYAKMAAEIGAASGLRSITIISKPVPVERLRELLRLVL